MDGFGFKSTIDFGAFMIHKCLGPIDFHSFPSFSNSFELWVLDLFGQRQERVMDSKHRCCLWLVMDEGEQIFLSDPRTPAWFPD